MENHWISPVSFYFVVQILSLSLSLIRHRLTFLPPVAPWRGWQVGRQADSIRLSAVGGVSMATDPTLLVAAALFAGNASAAAAAATAHLQFE